jgi:PAS domain S-box-containing protein
MAETAATRKLSKEVERLQRRIRELESQKRRAEAEQSRAAEACDSLRIALRRSEENSRQYFESANSIILRFDHLGRISYCNRFAEEFFGRDECDLLGRPVLGTVLPERESGGRDLSHLIEAILANPLRYTHHEHENVRGDGRRAWIAWTYRAITDEGGHVNEVLAIGNDITRRKMYEERLEKANEQLKVHADNLEELNAELEAFNRTVAHDLRAPLVAIKGFAQLIGATEPSLSEHGRNSIRRIERAVQRMNGLIRKLLDFSSATKTPLDPRRLNLSTIAQEAATTVAMEDSAREVEWSIQPDVYGWGDARLLHQVFQNLFANAWKYTRERRPARIGFHAETRSGRTFHCVTDNGIGFDQEQAARLFTPFARLENGSAYEGTGIGLATVARIIHRHGGEVFAEGTPGSGASFCFSLPEPVRGDL